jgi:hypothetical protein
VARDLIPPPSPAGRPSPDAMRHAGRRTHEPPPEEATEPQAAPERSGPAPFRGRFGFVTGALGGTAVAALVLFGVLLATSPAHKAPPASSRWSNWGPPSGDIITGPEAIADHVQTQYKRADGKQLVVVHGGPFYVSGTSPVPFLLRLQPADGSIRDLSNGVLYTLAGTGDRGAIVGDKSTPARQQLLRREALELALYTFRYVPNATSFVALLPGNPPKGKKAKQAAANGPQNLTAVFFQPDQLRSELKVPLSATLHPGLKFKPGQLGTVEAHRIDQLTKPNIYKAKFQQPSDGQLYLVLTR